MQITSIKSPLTLLHSNREFIEIGYGDDRRISIEDEIWSGQAPNAFIPVVFRMGPGGDRAVSLTVEGAFDFQAGQGTNKSWAGVRYRVRGTLVNTPAVTLVSDYAPWDVARPNAFRASGFRFGDDVEVGYPFNADGEWTWELSAEPPALGAANQNRPDAAVSQNRTRMEPYIFPAGAADPLFSGNGTPEYPLDLLRLVMVPYAAVALLHGNLGTRQLAYLRLLTDKLWNAIPNASRVRYDCEEGACSFSYREDVAGGGGEIQCFELGRFLYRPAVVIGDREYTYWRTCNCLDLSCFLQACIKTYGVTPAQESVSLGHYTVPEWIVLANRERTQFIPSRRQFKMPFGYVNRGPLFGWPAYPTCNNPFWREMDVQDAYQVADDHPGRTPMRSHWWVVCRIDGAAEHRMVDLTKALFANNQVTLVDGSHTRAQFLASAVDSGRQFALDSGEEPLDGLGANVGGLR